MIRAHSDRSHASSCEARITVDTFPIVIKSTPEGDRHIHLTHRVSVGGAPIHLIQGTGHVAQPPTFAAPTHVGERFQLKYVVVVVRDDLVSHEGTPPRRESLTTCGRFQPTPATRMQGIDHPPHGRRQPFGFSGRTGQIFGRIDTPVTAIHEPDATGQARHAKAEDSRGIVDHD